MEKLFKAKDGFIILDGGLGTMLQAAGMAPGESPVAFGMRNGGRLEAIHQAYVDAGADVITANTFGVNALKLEGSGITVEAAVQAAVGSARAAAGGKALMALDIGPLGTMLEPGGTLSFEAAYDCFAQVVCAGVKAGVDLVLIETMTGLLEIKAAVLAAKEHAALPVLASMSFEADGRTFSGVSIEAFAAAIGGLGVDALGLNCSVGPQSLMPLARRLCGSTNLPVFLQPNAGMPNPATGAYDLGPKAFLQQMEPALEMGVCMVGGCCGTTPQHIALLAESFGKHIPAARQPVARAVVCGTTRTAVVDGPLAIGERINPTGKKRLKEALLSGDIAYIQTLAVEQETAGAAILDVNVGAPGVDEVEMLPRAVRAVQAVSGLPLQLDSADPNALAAALRVCCGKPIVNSTSGEREKLETILPLCKKYGAAVVGLALDEDGIPPTAEGRLRVAERILAAATKAGLPNEDLYIDCLVLSVGAEPAAAGETLRAVELVKHRLGLKTVLGVSNVSFGLPSRPLVNRTFFAMALAKGLDLAIMNPVDNEMMGTLRAGRMLLALSESADEFVAFSTGAAGEAPAAAQTHELPLDAAIEKGLKMEAAAAARRLLAERPGDSLGLVEQYMIPALDRVGQGFEEKRVFLPQLLAAAAAAQAAFDELKKGMGENAAAQAAGTVVVATVQGDVHDIGKNIAKVLMQNYGFNVVDLGRDVPPGRVVEAAASSGAMLVGLSALMTTTLPAMQQTIAEIRKAGLACKVLVGGAVLTKDYARQIGADFYAKDAKASADYARSL